MKEIKALEDGVVLRSRDWKAMFFLDYFILLEHVCNSFSLQSLESGYSLLIFYYLPLLPPPTGSPITLLYLFMLFVLAYSIRVIGSLCMVCLYPAYPCYPLPFPLPLSSFLGPFP